MKKFLIVLIAFASFSFQSLDAQIKIGYINSLELLSLMPEVKSADAQLTSMAQASQKKLAEYQTQYQNKYLEIQNEGADWTEAVREAEVKELLAIENKIMTYEASAQKQLAEKREALYGPIFDKATKVVQEVAKANGYTYVFDSSNSGLVYAPEENNLLPLVKSAMGL